MDRINLAIIIVNYNTPNDVLACIKSIKNNKTEYSYKILVVDNCSTDNSISVLKTSNTDYTLIQAKENLGYCAGNNVGIHWAEKNYEVDYFWILNPDTEIDTCAINNLLDFAYSNQSYGLIGASLLYYYDKDTIQAIGGGKIGFSQKLNFQILTPYFRNQKFSEKKAIIPDVVVCESIVGAALLIKKDVLKTVGYFDESYFLYSDETEFCIRVLKLSNYKLCALKNVVVFHKEGGSQKNRKYITQYYLTRNWLYNVKKYYHILVPYVFVYHIFYLLRNIKKRELVFYTKKALFDFCKNIKGKYMHEMYKKKN